MTEVKPAVDATVFVQIEPADRDGRLIANRAGATDRLESRIADVRNGIKAGVAALEASLDDLASPPGWGIDGVDIKFGVSLGVEGSVLITKASAQSTFEITVSFKSMQ